uniref:Putative vetispiradiene synthase n=1 Tax=Scoparia dulcis TaxID=107240 RepID=A0A1W7HBX6_SCODU
MEPKTGVDSRNNGIVRPEANFSPSLWGDQFVTCVFNAEVAGKSSKEIEVMKAEVKRMLTSPGTKVLDTMNLIDTIERLGISYHFENEIEEKLEKLFNLNTKYEDNECHDLYTVALHFRIFRQHGYRISCDVFSKFRDGSGNFYEFLKDDPKGLLSLYEATQLRVHGECILEDALAFATASLKSIDPILESCFRKQVIHALVQPLHMGDSRIEARHFINIYEEDVLKNETLLKFAKLNYNLLQMLHKRELCEVSRWWKELDPASKFPYAKNRLVECFFWAMGTYYEPQYSRGRVMLTKSLALGSLIDDTYDAYGTLEELDIFATAIDRWEVGEIDRLPDYMKPLYRAILELYEQFEEELANEGRSYGVYYAREALKELVRSYNIEAKWFIKGEFPPFAEYLDNALITVTYHFDCVSALLGTTSATKEHFEWLSNKPKMLIASLTHARLLDDLATYEIEKERGQLVTGIECYMKEYRVTKPEVESRFRQMITSAWKDMNEEFFKPSPHPRFVLHRIINLARTMEAAFQGNHDGYTRPEKVMKPHILALFVEPIQI